jgi:NADH-quinone oxidoreductase subunit E
MQNISHTTLETLLPKASMVEIDNWINKYPKDQRQSAVMSTLRIAQEALGFLSRETMDAVATYLEMPNIAVYEVASFYTMYEHSPCGKTIINVCTNISCQLNGAEDTVKALEKKLNIKLGSTTEDGAFTLRKVECLGACVGAPAVQVNKTYFENITAENIDIIFSENNIHEGDR